MIWTQHLVVVTGLSGSGKTLAAQCLEDLGYFCVDNLPVSLIPPFCELVERGGEHIRRAALVIDAREGAYLNQFPAQLHHLRERRMPVQLLFFECSEEVLKRRFSESRRPHPMSEPQGTLDDAMRRERVALRPLRDMADRIIDTSQFTAHQLRSFLKSAYGNVEPAEAPNVNLVSFGFKHGAPAEGDLVFDVRFLPNPYFVDDLRPLDGRDARIQEFLDRTEVTGAFMKRLEDMLSFLLPLYQAEGKTYLTIAVGCTGGRHRSVALIERLGQYFKERQIPASVIHRDVGRP